MKNETPSQILFITFFLGVHFLRNGIFLMEVGLTALPEQYHYSSESFYLFQDDRFGFLSHYKG